MQDLPQTLPHNLPGGLRSEAADALADLIAEICAPATIAARPWIAPALLLSDPAVQTVLDLPCPGTGEMLIHDYQSVDNPARLPLDTDLRAAIERKGSEYRIGLAGAGSGAAAMSMTCALRVVQQAEIAALRPAPFPERALVGADWSRPCRVTQAQCDRYLALSGDGNPIHRDPALAADLGMAAPVVPGLLLLALGQPTAERLVPGRTPHRLTCRFMAPLATGAPFRIAAQRRGADRLRLHLLDLNGTALAIADLQFDAAI